MNRTLLEYCVAKGGYTATAMAQKLGLSRTSYYNKLKGKSPFTHGDICILVSTLKLTRDELVDIFFANVVE